MKKIFCTVLIISIAQITTAQVLGGGLTGTATRMLQVNSSGELTPLAPGTSSQVLFGNGTWGNLPWSTGGSNILFLTGNVGVGNSNPQNTLDVTGTLGVTGNTSIGGNLTLSSLAGSGNRLAVINSSGVISAGSTMGSGNYWDLVGNSGTDEGTTNFLGTTDNKDIVFKTNSIERMRITSHAGNNHEEGRVYIGGGDLITQQNDLPGNWDDKLIIKDALRIVNDALSPSKCALIGNDGANTFIESFNINPPDEPGFNWYNSPDGILMGWYSGADVHIGYQGTGQGGNLSVQNEAVVGSKLGVGGLPTARFTVFNPASGNPFKVTDGTNAFLEVASNGNVGLGTSTPYRMLTVNGDAAFANYSTSGVNANSNGLNGIEILGGDKVPTRRGISTDNDPDGDFNFYINSNQGWTTNDPIAEFNFKNGVNPNNPLNLMTLNANGQLILGASSNNQSKPTLNSLHNTAILQVKGDVVVGTGTAANIYVTQNGWADFVFDKEYKLMSLADLEEFYKANHHLPNVPTTKDIQEQGNNLGQTDVVLLQKIEELTIYVVEMKKELDRIKEENKQLKKTIGKK